MPHPHVEWCPMINGKAAHPSAFHTVLCNIQRAMFKSLPPYHLILWYIAVTTCIVNGQPLYIVQSVQFVTLLSRSWHCVCSCLASIYPPPPETGRKYFLVGIPQDGSIRGLGSTSGENSPDEIGWRKNHMFGKISRFFTRNPKNRLAWALERLLARFRKSMQHQITAEIKTFGAKISKKM